MLILTEAIPTGLISFMETQMGVIHKVWLEICFRVITVHAGMAGVVSIYATPDGTFNSTSSCDVAYFCNFQFETVQTLYIEYGSKK